MRAVLVIACISVFGLVSATVPPSVTEKLADLFSVRVDQAEYCVNQTKVTGEDLRTLERELSPIYNASLLEQDNTRRAICTLTCIAQAQGTMRGAKLQMPRIHQLVEVSKMPQTTKNPLHQLLDLCYTEVEEYKDECEVGLRFVTCLILRDPTK